MTTMAMTTRRTLAIVAITLLTAGLGACGDDDSDETSSKDDKPSTETTAAGTDTDAYCAAELKVEQTSMETGGPESDPVKDTQKLLDVAKKAQALAPEAAAAPFEEGIAVLEKVIETGDGSLLETFDGSAIHQVDLQTCGWSTTDLTAADYSFNGLPEALDAGVHSFEIHNEGQEPHVMVVVRKAEGVTESWDEILAGDFEQEGKAVGVAAAFAPPGADGYGVGDLEPGEYLAFCPITVGSSMTGDGDGPPHFMSGMRAEFTVE